MCMSRLPIESSKKTSSMIVSARAVLFRVLVPAFTIAVVAITMVAAIGLVVPRQWQCFRSTGFADPEMPVLWQMCSLVFVSELLADTDGYGEWSTLGRVYVFGPRTIRRPPASMPRPSPAVRREIPVGWLRSELLDAFGARRLIVAHRRIGWPLPFLEVTVRPDSSAMSQARIDAFGRHGAWILDRVDRVQFHALAFVVDFGIVFVVCVVGIAAVRWYIGWSRPRDGACVVCKYCVHGLATCPECGRAVLSG